jgi:hypothetical protein
MTIICRELLMGHIGLECIRAMGIFNNVLVLKIIV